MKEMNQSTRGKVFLVGAGPGDKGLITLSALGKLKTADVVVYDRLINTELLSFCKDDCEKIFVGKESGFHPIEQEKIIQILIDKACQGLDVVRLKGGNPFVFGRGSEEAADLKKAGIDFEIIPGITSGLAAPIYSGIPITQRGLITQCIFVTAHECPDKPGTQVEWDKLAKLKNTSLIIYMGASRIAAICDTLIKNGMDPSMHAAAIENATLPVQRTITARLDTIAEKFQEENFHSPVIIIISPAVSLREDVCWFEKKPLFNRRIVIAGADQHYNYYNNLFSDSGAEILFLPVTSIECINSDINFPGRISDDTLAWIIFTNKFSVQSFFEIMKREKLDARKLSSKKIAAFGSGTAEMLASCHLICDVCLEHPDADSIYKFISSQKLQGKKVLFVQKEPAFDYAYGELLNSGVMVDEIKVYKTRQGSIDPALMEKINSRKTDIFLFADSASVDFTLKSLGTEKTSELLLNSSTVIIETSEPEKALVPDLKKLSINNLLRDIDIKEFINKFEQANFLIK